MIPLDNVVVTPGSEEILGIPETWDGVAQRLQSYSLRDALDLITKIAVLLAQADHWRSPETQIGILASLFGQRSPALRNLRAFARSIAKDGREPPIVLFHEAQLVNAVKAAFLSIPPAKFEGHRESDPKRLGQALLIINGLIARGENPPGDPKTPEGRKAWELFLLSNTIFNAGDWRSRDLARAAELYLRDRAHLSSLPDYRNLAADLRSLTGLDVEALWTILFAFYAYWHTLKANELPTTSMGVRKETFFQRDLAISNDEVETFFRLASQDASALAKAVNEAYAPPNLRPFHIAPLARRPIVRIGEEYFPTALRFLRDKLTTGLHHLFLDPKVGLPRKDRNQYLRYMGHVWEDYVRELLDRSYHGGDATIARGEELEERLKRKAVDFAILLGDVVVLIEAKATLFTLEVRAGADWDGYLGKLEDLVFDAAAQLDATIKGIDSGLLADLGFEKAKIRLYLPVVISLEKLVLNPVLGSRIEERLATEGWLQGDGVAPLQVLDPSETEMWEAGVTAGHEMHLVLAAKTMNHQWRWNSFRNYCIAVNHPAMQAGNAYLEDRFRALTDGALAHLKPLWREGRNSPFDNATDQS